MTVNDDVRNMLNKARMAYIIIIIIIASLAWRVEVKPLKLESSFTDAPSILQTKIIKWMGSRIVTRSIQFNSRMTYRLSLLTLSAMSSDFRLLYTWKLETVQERLLPDPYIIMFHNHLPISFDVFS